MSKKNTNVAETGTETENMVVTNTYLDAVDQAISEGLITEAPTLKAIAAALDVPATRVYAVSKQPKEGEIYDRNQFNMDAVERFILRRLDEGESMYEFVLRVIEKDKELQTQDGRRRRAGTGENSAKNMITITEPDGTTKLMPARKFTDLKVGDKVMLKKEEFLTVYTIVYMSDTHLILQINDGPELKAMSNWTVNYLLIPPARFEEAYEQRKARLEAQAAEAAIEESDVDMADAEAAEVEEVHEVIESAEDEVDGPVYAG